MRTTDHRIGLKFHQSTEVTKGGLDTVIQPLTAARQAEALVGQEA